MKKEEDYIMISGFQHFEYCRRQWALAYLETQWIENQYTIEGELQHNNVDNGIRVEKRKDTITTRHVFVKSDTYKITGICDVVEFKKDESNGIYINSLHGKYSLLPIDYKHGKPKQDDSDKLQVTAYAMCLEEMYCTEINKGALFYEETKRREYFEITPELRNKVISYSNEMNQYLLRKYTPKVKYSKKCRNCSLKNICIPKMKTDVKKYVNSIISEELKN